MCAISLAVCVREGSPQSPASYCPETFMRSRLSHTAVVTDSSCWAERKTAFKIRVFKSKYYSGIWASAQLNSRWHSITLPLMEENLWVSERGPVSSWQTHAAAAPAGGFGLRSPPSASNCEELRQGRGPGRLGSHLDLIGDERKLSHPEKRPRARCQKWPVKEGTGSLSYI